MSLVQQQSTQIHPIGEFSDPHHVRAIGLLRGNIASDWSITLAGGFHGKSIKVRAEAFGLIQKLAKSGVDSAIFVVWPRTKDGFVSSLEVIGVWKPSILDPNSGAQDDLPEGDNYFSIRGEVCSRVWRDERFGRAVAVRVYGEHFVTVDFGDAPFLSQGDFVNLDSILTEDGRLYTERVEVIPSANELVMIRPSRTLVRPGQQIRRRSSAA